MPSVALALDLAEMGLPVRRRGWPEGDFIKAHKPAEWGFGPAPDVLPGDDHATLYTPSGDDLSSDDWELA